MKAIKRNLFLLLTAAILVASLALTACGTKKVGRINAPETLEAELGAYMSPDYEVVDPNGVVLYGYDVRLGSVTDPNGEAMDIVNESVTVENAGVYTFVYTADSKNVADAIVKIDFADRTAPTIHYDSSRLPAFYIKGNSYSMPEYTLSGDYDRTKCWAKVFHIAADKTETEVSVSGNRFAVERDGHYAIRIHVEDAVGNANDYEYIRAVDGPAQLKENTILYFGEAFGARQMKMREPNYYSGAYVSKAAAAEKEIPARDGADDAGYYAVSFNGQSDTIHNEGYAIIDVPAISDVRGMSEFYLWVYYDGDNKFPTKREGDTVVETADQVVIGSTWWNDTAVPNRTWTKVTWSVNNWGYNVDRNEKQVGASDITGTQIRMIFDFAETVKPNGTFYFTEMIGVPKIPTTLNAADEDVIIEGNRHYIGDSVTLSAVAKEGKTVDCYTVDGTPLAGNTFVPTKTEHAVGVRYVDGDLTADNMTLGMYFGHPVSTTGWLGENGLSMQFAGKSDYWAIELDVVGGYDAAAGGNCKFNLSFAVGNMHTMEIYIGNDFNGCKWYYKGGSTWGEVLTTFNAAQIDLFKNASAEAPVRVLAMRRGQDLRVFVNNLLIGRSSLDGYSYSDDFGYGYRNDMFKTDDRACVEVKDATAVSGENKVDAVLSRFISKITVIDETVILETDTVHFGDEVRLTPAAAPDGKIFAYYELDGERKAGDWNSFMATKATHTIEAIYVDAVTITLEGGARINGKSDTVQVPKGETVTITYLGDPGAGKFFDCFTVDGAPIATGTFVPTKDAYTVGVKTATNASDMTWGRDTDSHVKDYSYNGGYAYSGTHVGEATYWVIDATVKYPTPLGDAWYIFDFSVGSDRFIQMRIHPTGLVQIKKMTWEVDIFEPSAEQKAKIVNACNTKDEVSIVCVRQGNEYMLLFEGEILGKFTFDFAAADNKFGMGGCNISWNNNGNAWSANNDKQSYTYRYIFGADKVEAYLDAVRIVEIAAHDSLVTLGDDGVYTLPTAIVKDISGNTADGEVVISVKDATGKTYTVADGKVTVDYAGAIDLLLTYSIAGAKTECTVSVQRAGGLVLEANATGAKVTATTDCTTDYDADKQYGNDTGSVKVTLSSSETALKLCAFDYTGYDFIEYWAYTDAEHVSTGAHWYGDITLTKDAWTHVRVNLRKKQDATIPNNRYNLRINGAWNGDANAPFDVTGSHVWISSVRVGKYAQNQINDVTMATGGDATYELAADKTYDGNDSAIVDKTVLKVTYNADKNEVGFAAGMMILDDISGYDEIYFYVYVSDAGMEAGTWWCGDTKLVAEQWTKVTITKDMAGLTGLNNNNPFDANKAWAFVYRMQNGGGKTVYFTSLYGVPKA